MVILDWLYEYWVPAYGYEGRYEVSNWCRLKSLIGKEKLLTPHYVKPDNRKLYSLTKDGKTKGILGYRLLAQSLIPNTDNLPQINHRDEDPTNDQVWNLEWCDAKYNSNYGSRNERIVETNNRRKTRNAEKPVLQYTKDGQLVNRYKSIPEAVNQTGFKRWGIQDCARNKAKSAYGYIWRYEN